MLDTSRAKKLFRFESKTSFEEGLRCTIEWYLPHLRQATRCREGSLTGTIWMLDFSQSGFSSCCDNK
jgi:dTDP-D-glucose 4,6-dehydratase